MRKKHTRKIQNDKLEKIQDFIIDSSIYKNMKSIWKFKHCKKMENIHSAQLINGGKWQRESIFLNAIPITLTIKINSKCIIQQINSKPSYKELQ